MKRPAMIGSPESHRWGSLLIPMSAIASRKPQSPVRTLDVVIEEVQTHQRIPGLIAFREGVRLAGQGSQPIAQRPIEPFDMDRSRWLARGPQRGPDLHRQQPSSLITMRDRVRHTERLWDHQTRASPVPCQHWLAGGSLQETARAMPSLAEPAEGALLRPLDGAAHRVLDQLLTQRASGAGDHDATVAVLDQAAPVLSFVWVLRCSLFWRTHDQNASMST